MLPSEPFQVTRTSTTSRKHVHSVTKLSSLQEIASAVGIVAEPTFCFFADATFEDCVAWEGPSDVSNLKVSYEGTPQTGAHC